MIEAYIKAISYYLPSKVLTNADIHSEFPEWSVEKVATKIGISQRHISDDNEFVSDMAVRVGNKLFSEWNIDRNKIDFILICTQSPDYFLPTTACIVQDKLGIPTSSGAIDINQGCSGYVYGLSLAKGLILSESAENILFITAETYSKYLHPQDKSNKTIFGDAASATIISNSGIGLIKKFYLGSDGSGMNDLIVKNGGSRNPSKGASVDMDEFGNIVSGDHLFMNGGAIFNFTLNMVPVLVQETLSRNNTSADNIDQFVFHQANQYMLNHLRKKIGIPIAKFPIHMQDCGNTVSSTIPIVLKRLIDRKEKGDFLLAGFGVGYSWGGTVITFHV